MSAIPPLGVRLPVEVKEKVKAAATVSRRSMNSEIVFALERFYETNDRSETQKADATA